MDSKVIIGNELSPEEYNSLREQAGWQRLSDSQAERGLKNTAFTASARADGRIVGMGRCLFDFGYTAYIGDVIVIPDYQGRGIGKAIVEDLKNKAMNAAEIGDSIFFVLASAKGKEKFYEKCGFKKRTGRGSGCGMSMMITKK